MITYAYFICFTYSLVSANIEWLYESMKFTLGNQIHDFIFLTDRIYIHFCDFCQGNTKLFYF